MEGEGAAPAMAALDMCKMVERRTWGSKIPLRRSKGIPNEVVRKTDILLAFVAIVSSAVCLNVLSVMEPSRCVQACWETHSSLKQIPHFEPKVVDRRRI